VNDFAFAGIRSNDADMLDRGVDHCIARNPHSRLMPRGRS
jgi:hypothetical protein